VFRKWNDIKGFHNLKSSYEAQTKSKNLFFPMTLVKGPIVYKTKVKLHGQNAAVNISKNGVALQSRKCLLDRNHALAKTVGLEKFWQAMYNLVEDQYQRVVVYGELCGPKIQKGVALSKLKKNIFAVFAIQLESYQESNDTLHLDPANDDNIASADLIVEPEDIKAFMTKSKLPMPENVHVLPWFRKGKTFSLSLDKKNKKEIDMLNKYVDMIDKQDPWVKEVFGIVGHGEGLVAYPISFLDTKTKRIMRCINSTFCFKAKGSSHQVTKSKKAVKEDPEKLASIKAYVDYMCAEPRLQQGAAEVCGQTGDAVVYQFKHIKDFIDWVIKDVEKEGQDELKKSNLAWKDVRKTVSSYASKWYSTECKKKK